MEEFFNPERIQLRNLNEIKAFKFNDEGQQTKTSIEQVMNTHSQTLFGK